MGKKKRNGGRRNPITVWVDRIFDALGLFIAATPAIEVLVNDIPSGNWQGIPNDTLFAYTGLGGTTPINTGQTVKGLGAVAGGAVVSQVPRIYRLFKRILRGR